MAAIIAKNLEAEASAIEGYNELLALSPALEVEDRATIAEIISDEKNHMEKLNAMMLKYDGNIAPAKD